MMRSTQTAAAPRQFLHPATPAPILPGPGLPHERHARIAARRSFVGLKNKFIAAVAALGGPRGDWLRYQVRQAQEPVDLWLLRGAVYAALPSLGPSSHRIHQELNGELDSVFPDGGELTPYLPLLR